MPGSAASDIAVEQSNFCVLQYVCRWKGAAIKPKVPGRGLPSVGG